MEQYKRVTESLTLDDGQVDISILTDGHTCPTGSTKITIGDYTFDREDFEKAIDRAGLKVRAENAVPGGVVVDVFITYASHDFGEYKTLQVYRHLREYMKKECAEYASPLGYSTVQIESILENRKKVIYDIIANIKVACKDTSKMMEYLNGFHNCHVGIDICAYSPNGILVFTDKSPITLPRYAAVVSAMTGR